ncbi:MAG: hypothetical protein WCP39_07140 [Chlamydiota bacterium]
MFQHTFIVQPSSWAGEGTITLNMVEENLQFLTRWKVSEVEEGKITSVQELQIVGVSENMRNELVFFDFTPKSFSLEMENVNIGKVLGTGIYDEKMIAWEFRNNDLNFEGFETYTLQGDGSYLVHAEYVTSDQFRTQIDGKIWKPSNPELFEKKQGEE